MLLLCHLQTKRFLSGDGEEASKYKGGDGHDTVFSGGIAAGYDFTRSSVFRFVRNWSFTLVEKLIRKYNVDKDSWLGGYRRDDPKNEVSVNNN